MVDAHFTPCGIKYASIVILTEWEGERHWIYYDPNTLIGKVIPK